MALCVLKWLMLIPVSFAITLASCVIAPIAALLADSDGCLPKWLRWASTPHGWPFSSTLDKGKGR